MKNWMEILISSIACFFVGVLWQYLMLKNIDWIEVIVITIIFAVIEFVYYSVREKRLKKEKDL